MESKLSEGNSGDGSMKIVKNRNLGKAADVLSFVALAIGGWLLHTGDLGGLAFVAFGMAHQLYYMPVIVMTMDTFFNGETKVK